MYKILIPLTQLDILDKKLMAFVAGPWRWEKLTDLDALDF